MTKVNLVAIICYNTYDNYILGKSLKLYNKKLIIFDLDGTLIDSGPDLASALNYMLEQLNRKTYTLETIDSWVGNGAQTLVKRALSGSVDINEDIDETLFNKALKIFLDYYEQNVCVHTRTYQNVGGTLISLRSRGYKFAIVTNKPYKFIEPILKKLELLELFDLCIGGDSLELKKPSPAPLLYVCKELGVEVQNSLMIGDSKNDILAANACEMQSIGVSYGYNYGEDIRIYNPSIVIDDFKDILAVISDDR